MAKDKIDKVKIRLTVPPSFEGVSSVVVFDAMIKENVELIVNYQRSLDFREFGQFAGVDINVVLGSPYRGYELPKEFYEEVSIPFVEFIHFSTFGIDIEHAKIISHVEEGKDPILNLYERLVYRPDSTILSNHVELSDKVENLVYAINAYRTWTWEGNNIVRVLLALYNASYKRMPELVRGMTLANMVRNNAPVIRGQMEKMDNIIERAIETSYTETISYEGRNVTLRVAFSTEYVNEIANALLGDRDTEPIIVCVGRPTKGNDLMSIRTRNINAEQIAYQINEGGGKEEIASAFFGASYSVIMGESIKTKLESSS